MGKIAVVYWSQTGNTQAMANAIAEGAEHVEVFEVNDFSADKVADYDAFAFGCPAMGAEELDHDEFEPVWDACVAKFGPKPVALFGSYDWGDGEWLRTWEEDAKSRGVNVVESLAVNLEPDDEGVEACKALATKLAG